MAASVDLRKGTSSSNSDAMLAVNLEKKLFAQRKNIQEERLRFKKDFHDTLSEAKETGSIEGAGRRAVARKDIKSPQFQEKTKLLAAQHLANSEALTNKMTQAVGQQISAKAKI